MGHSLKGRRSPGYSLIELLVVLAIVGILGIAGVVMIGNRQPAAVRSLVDELEGALSNAHQAAIATGRDVAIVTWGSWDASAPLRLAFGDASLKDEEIQTTANNLLLGIVPDPALGVAGQTVSIPFRFIPNDLLQTRAAIVALGSDQWTNAMTASGGKQNTSISADVPFSSGPMSTGVLTDANRLFNGTLQRVVISGSNRRFTSTFIIPVVGTTTAGSALPAGPMGMIVVLANGGSIYKFYNSGANYGGGTWRRI